MLRDTDWERTSQHPINTRDAAVAALSDAQFVAPLVHTGDTLAPPPALPGQEKSGPKCFFYVFDYQTKEGDYPQRMGTVHGEDLPYVFGAPLVDGFSFLNANPSPQIRARVANYGLMDQMAALHWVQQNIAKFGGDPGAVTLAGHGSGAACINFLMTSPTMVPGLFHRAILLSGSAYASWAVVEDPVVYALKLAKELNCTVPSDLIKNHEQIVDCLREIPLDDLLNVNIQAPSYLSAFGPSIDGVVIRTGLSNQDPDELLSSGTSKRSHDSYRRYDLLFGVVTAEALWRFSNVDILNGFEGERRDKIIRTYVRNAYTFHLSEIFYT
uniref:Carboxylesterase type B domain-containing protein n=1 Tax=Phlebotomus papatasi TaxID=29031 RepID=A0A1B0DKM1_PHLPP